MSLGIDGCFSSLFEVYEITARFDCTPLDVIGLREVSGVTDITGGRDFTGDAVCLTAPEIP